ncbi:MAG: Fic family protein [Streptococcaceae bacterium]|jgi:Fic family protein|nr:Fic family protein [Streptococcaceae bacterium]
MRQYDYVNKPSEYLTSEIVTLIAGIHEHKRRQDLLIETNADELNTTLDVAKIQSTGASNRIEGISTSDKRLEELVHEKSEPQNRSEQEIFGYKEVLQTIHENYEYISPTPNILLQFHRDLYSYSDISIGGNYKNSDNIISEADEKGKAKAKFIPVPAYQAKDAIKALCQKFTTAINKKKIDSLILIPMFILNFLSIHPFNDGNGRMSKLLTLLLYYRNTKRCKQVQFFGTKKKIIMHHLQNIILEFY